MKELLGLCSKHDAGAAERVRNFLLDPLKHETTFKSSMAWMSAEKPSVQRICDLVHELHESQARLGVQVGLHAARCCALLRAVA